MQPNFANLKPVTNSGQPVFANLKPGALPSKTQTPKSSSDYSLPGNIGKPLDKKSKSAQIVSGIKGTLKQGAQDIIGSVQNIPIVAQPAGGGVGPTTLATVGAIGHIAGTVAGTAGGILNSFISPFLPEQYKKNMSEDITILDNQLKQHLPPEVHKALGDVLNTLLLKEGKETEPMLVKGVSKGVELAKKTISDVGKSFAEKEAAKSAAKLQENIMPKPTVKEAKIAMKEGRFVEGKEPTLFKSGTEDKILPSKEAQRANATIIRRIPNADKLSEVKLYDSLEQGTKKMATDLKPEMQKVPVNKNITGKAIDNWEKLKTEQIENAPKLEEPNVTKRQAKFQKILDELRWDIKDPSTGKFKTPTKKTMDDIWQARIDYDNSISESVKKASPISDASLLDQKQEWLDNRAILNDIINDSSTGLGKTSQQAFSDMSDMYRSKENILSKAKVDTKVKPSKISQAYNSKTGKLIRGTIKGGATIGGLYEGGKKLITGSW